MKCAYHIVSTLFPFIHAFHRDEVEPAKCTHSIDRSSLLFSVFYFCFCALLIFLVVFFFFLHGVLFWRRLFEMRRCVAIWLCFVRCAVFSFVLFGESKALSLFGLDDKTNSLLKPKCVWHWCALFSPDSQGYLFNERILMHNWGFAMTMSK